MTSLDLSPVFHFCEGKRPKVLLYHPDEAFRQSLTETLEPNSLEVVIAEDIPSALRLLKSSTLHAAILSGGRGGTYSGFDVLRQIRGHAETEAMPVLVLTEGADYERIVSLELGADDCMLAPFSNREIRLRVQSLLRRSFCQQNGGTSKPVVIDTPEFYFNPLTLEVRVSGEAIHLTGTEVRILVLLVNRLGVVVEKQTLIDALSPSPENPHDYRTINTQMRRLRKKLGPMGEYLQNIRDVGYRFSWKEC